MSLILQIDTATEKAHVSLARDGRVLQQLRSDSQKDHASFLQPAIGQLVKEEGVTLNDIDAVSVTMGPGSYTGLRVGMASAKGLCYVLNKPLIALNTLEVIALSTMHAAGAQDAATLFCPMIDARRMEVFTALYDSSRQLILEPCAMILDNTSFNTELEKSAVLFSGNGSAKFRSVCDHPNARFYDVAVTAEAMATLSLEQFSAQRFASLAYTEPLYIKEFQDFTSR
jgi:tRNA threonylcarbamoyladenosine biosynthesis protein TsaB